jgi:hypothetical protein
MNPGHCGSTMTSVLTELAMKQAFVYHRSIAPASGTVRFARALDRAVTGCMNELIIHETSLLVGGELSPFDVGFRLNEALLSALAASRAETHGTPRGAFKAMASGIAPDVA